MTYVGILTYQNHVLFVVEPAGNNSVRLFEDAQLAQAVVDVFKEDPAVHGTVISYEMYLKLLNNEITVEEIFTTNSVALA